MAADHALQAEAAVDLDAQAGLLRSMGAWTLPQIRRIEQSLRQLDRALPAALRWDLSAMTSLDTAGAWLIHRAERAWRSQGRHVELEGLSAEHAALLQMVAQGDSVAARPAAALAPGMLEGTGRWVWSGVSQGLGFLGLVGENVLAGLRLLASPGRIRVRAVLHNMQTAGADALFIIGLLSFLVGVVIAYQSAVLLRRYGANIYIADLVGLSMLRELAGLMTAIIVAGRSGSAFTAQIGTMQVTEEIDALRTVGISPMELLVIPKVWALIVALPLLTVFSDIMGVAGGMLVAQVQLGVSPAAFLGRFQYAVSLTDLLVGVGKAPVFAVIIALIGCYQGFQVRGGADSVGRQTTVSVVQGIFLVIMADALFSIGFSWFHI
jgi:phospholipid/cholesterol/gamma-HCH transport system permease protein